jgi:hypothetical protein
MLLHPKTLEGWTNVCTQQSGPSVERIMEKAMTLFEKLEGITTTDLVHFHDTFQKTGSVYLLPFMPFDAVSLKLSFEGLCPPGLGIDRYAASAAALMEVIPRLLPAHIARLYTVIATVRADSNNGHDLMWRLLALAVPGFDPAQHVLAPVWEDFQDIFDFCHVHILYFCLQAKGGLYYNKRTRSSTFLRAIQQMEYVDVVTTLQTHIESYQDMDAGYLPPNLCMLELTNWIDKNTRAWVSQYDLPRVNRMYGDVDLWDDDTSASPQIQGFTPAFFCTDLSGRGREFRRNGAWDNQSSSGVQGGAHDNFHPREPNAVCGQYDCPDHNHQKFDPALICVACKQRGHPAAQCDLLAQAIFLTKYMKHTLTDQARTKIEEAWLKRWKDQLGRPSRTPRKVLHTFLDNMDMSVDDLDTQMCWECWPLDDNVEDFPELTQE